MVLFTSAAAFSEEAARLLAAPLAARTSVRYHVEAATGAARLALRATDSARVRC